MTIATKAKLSRVQSCGYRFGVGEQNGLWIVTAKRGCDGQFHVAKGRGEVEAVDALLALMDIAVNEDRPPK